MHNVSRPRVYGCERMELSVIAVTLAVSMTLALVGAYAAVSLVLFCVRRAVIRAEERPVKLPAAIVGAP
jgi:energy-converting hydrogenase Eha subunit E